ncbi:MAG: ATP-binding protein [Bacteroidales bacterium]|nr:ATP-binding protein [Bacteroidales bacterium]
MIKRHIEEKALYFSGKYPVVTITGPRQSGKTILVETLFKDHEYYSLENPITRAQIQEDPSILFLPEGKKIIIDEVQRVPDLLSFIQVHSDRQKINGQFIITGSQSLLLSEKISQTLAGRTAILKLLPLSLSEMKSQEKYSGDNYEDWLFRGFYPRIYDQNMVPADFFPFYFETYLQRDVREIQNVRDLSRFSNFVKLCAGRVGQLVDYSSLANDAGVSINTAKGWLSLLEASYVITLLNPYYKNLNKRVIKSPKLYFIDVGLASFLLDIQNPKQLSTHYLRGNLFENLIILELLKKRFNNAQLSNLYFFRDSNKNEVDCIMEEVELKAMEIKSAKSFSNSFIDGLKSFARFSEMKTKNGNVIYGGEDSFSFKDFNVISWRNLDALHQK